MSLGFWDQPARLLREPAPAASWKGGRRPQQVSIGSLAEAARQIATEDPEEIWRFVIVTGDGHHIRSAELRALLRRGDLPAASGGGARS